MELSPEFDLAHADATSPAIAVKIIAEVRHATDLTLSYARRSLPITMRICDLLGYSRLERIAVTGGTSAHATTTKVPNDFLR